MSFNNAVSLLETLRQQYKNDDKQAAATQNTLLQELMKLNLLFPSNIEKEALLSREFYEISILILVKNNKIAEFNRYYTLLKEFPNSPRTPMIQGLYLIYLLSVHKITEFHIELERIELDNIYVQQSIKILESLIEGIWNQ